MRTKNDGGKAFPEPGVYDASRDQVNSVSAYYDAGGMSLRDYFAAKAFTALWNCDDDWNPDMLKAAAKVSFKIADYMLAERERK